MAGTLAVTVLRTHIRVLSAACLLASAAGAQSWALSAEPVLVIGAADDTLAEFASIAHVARFSNGDISVTIPRPPEIRLFAADGAFRRPLARPGGGPGELGVLWWVGRSADSLVTYDFSQSRITIFDARNEQVTTIPFAPSGAPSRMVVIGSLDGGQWLVSTQPAPFPRAHPDGPYRDSTVLGVWNRTTGTVTLVGTFPNFALFAHNGPRGTSFAFDLLTANTSFVPVGSEIWVGIPDRDELLVVDLTGRQSRRLRVPVGPRPYRDDEMLHERNRLLEVMKDAEDSARTAAMFDAGRRGDPPPRFARLFRGTDGHVWIETFQASRTAGTEYVAVDRAGRIVGRFTGPPGVRFLEIGSDYALGVRRDDVDVETVVLYRIQK